MEIQEVLKRADALLPNPYTEEEKCRWCDELGALLVREYKKPYGRRTLRAENSSILLSEDIEFEDIVRAEAAGRIIPKRDMRAAGERILYYPHGGRAVLLPVPYTGSVTISFLEHYEPVRNINAKNENVTVVPVGGAEDDKGILTKIPYFRTEDVLRLTIDGETLDAHVLGVEISDSGYVVAFQRGALGGRSGRCSADIYRYLTDETVCPAPYDVMYVNFVCAKACYYQRDYEAYNQNMSLVNAQLDAYARELKNHAPTDNDGQLINWW